MTRRMFFMAVGGLVAGCRLPDKLPAQPEPIVLPAPVVTLTDADGGVAHYLLLGVPMSETLSREDT